MVLNPQGEPLNDKVRIRTPRPADPAAILKVIAKLTKTQPDFRRISIGFPGVVQYGVISSAPNLDGDWAGVPLAERVRQLTGKPCRVANDADMQGYGAIEGSGVEMVLTLGTGMGSAVFSNGHLVPNLELGHHPCADGLTYEQLVGKAARKTCGNASWNQRVKLVIDLVRRIWNPRVLYIGGGNVKHLTFALPHNVRTVANVAGIIGGICLWEDEDH
ncbi:MAG: ROK family protein [Gammaproteobacteria bacterium]|nr:ROK family protein [Gammaproteobacteria bacterium]